MVCLMLLGVMACKPNPSDPSDATSNPPSPTPGARITYTIEDDGLAEVARYSYRRAYLGVERRGSAALIIDHEEVHPRTYVPSRKGEQRIGALRISLIKDLPSLGGDLHQHISVTSGLDHRPMHLAINEDDWLGGHVLDWMARGDQAQIFWRASLEDSAPVNAERSVSGGYYFYEQLPLIVRAGMYGAESRKVRIALPQTGRLEPAGETLLVDIVRVKEKIPLSTPAGDFVSTLIEVRPTARHGRFPGPEKYWLEQGSDILLKATRHEVIERDGALDVVEATYLLLDHARIDHRRQALPPATASARDRWRATLDAQIEYDLRKSRATLQGKPFDPETLRAGDEPLPAEYISSPEGNRAVHDKPRGKGGWVLDTQQEVMGSPGRMIPDVKRGWSEETEGFHD